MRARNPRDLPEKPHLMGKKPLNIFVRKVDYVKGAVFSHVG